MSQDVPSVAAVSSFQQAQIAGQVATAVARKSLDAAKAQGEAALSLLQAAVDIQKQTLPTEPGKGTRIDLQA